MNVLVLSPSATPPAHVLHLVRTLGELGHSAELLSCGSRVELSVRALVRCLRRRPEIIHAVDETVVIARVLQVLFGIPFLHQMDSVPKDGVLQQAIRSAATHALAVLPSCPVLAKIAEQNYGGARVIELPGVSLFEGSASVTSSGLRGRIDAQGSVFMYVGNLESHQGIGLLLEAFSLHNKKRPDDALVIIGGPQTSVSIFEQRSTQLGCARAVHFIGPQPVAKMRSYFQDADVLVSPRIKGQVVPTKLYSYLDSGRAVLATRLMAHTQAVTDAECALADATPEQLAEGMRKLAASPELRERVAAAAKQLVARKHSHAIFKCAVEFIYGLVTEAKVGKFQ